jgi:hypothetical protein
MDRLRPISEVLRALLVNVLDIQKHKIGNKPDHAFSKLCMLRFRSDLALFLKFLPEMDLDVDSRGRVLGVHIVDGLEDISIDHQGRLIAHVLPKCVHGCN